MMRVFGKLRIWLKQNGETVECNDCSKAVREKKAHVRVDTDSRLDSKFAAEAGVAGAQTAMIGEYCDKHCPGGCLRGCKEKRDD